MKLLIAIILITFSFSCSTSSKKTKVTKRKSTKELLKDFKVDEKVIEKYEVNEPNPPTKKEIQAAKTESRKPSVPAKPVVRTIPTNTRVAPVPSERVGKRAQKELDEFKTADLATVKWWGQFKPRIITGEKLSMDMTYLGMKTGTIVLETKANTQLGVEPVYNLHAELTSSSSYRWIYEMDNKVDSYVRIKDFHPKKYQITQRESAQSVDDLQLFDSQTHRVMWFYERSTKNKKEKKKRSFATPVRFQDPLSVLYFIRGLPLTKGVTYSVPVMNKSKLLSLDVTMEETEVLETAIGKMETLRVRILTQYTGESLKSGDMTFWFSNDLKRIFVKVKAKIKIGNVTGEITKYE